MSSPSNVADSPITRRDQLVDYIASGGKPGLKELGVTPHPLGLFLDRWMVRYRKHGRFGDKQASA